LTWFKVKVARRKQQQTNVFSFFHLSPQRNATQENGIITLQNSASDEKHASITSSGTVSFRVSARESASLREIIASIVSVIMRQVERETILTRLLSNARSCGHFRDACLPHFRNGSTANLSVKSCPSLDVTEAVTAPDGSGSGWLMEE